jgi:hypothetical protein
MGKEDFSTKNSVSFEKFEDIEKWQYVFIVGFKNGECFLDNITDDWTAEKMINTKNVELFTAERQKEYYDKEFDFYFIFSEEDERREFIEENKLKPQQLNTTQ